MKYRWLTRCLQWKRNILVTLLLIVALLMTLSRLVVVALAHHPVYIEKWLSATLSQPVKIQKIKADWAVFDPGLSFQKVLIQSVDGRISFLQIKQLTLSIDIFRSLLYWRLLPRRLKVQGVNIDIDSINGHLQVRGILSNKKNVRLSQYSTNFKRLLMGIMAEGHVSIDDANVKYHAPDHHTYYLRHLNFNVKNHALMNKVSGHAILDLNMPDDLTQKIQPTQLRFSVQLSHMDFKNKDIDGEIYLQLKNIHLGQWSQSAWLKSYFKSAEGLRGSSDVEAWFDWQKTKISAIEGRWQLRHVQWLKNVKPLVTISAMHGFFSWHASDHVWGFEARPFYVAFPALYRLPLLVKTLNAHFQWRHADLIDQLYVSNYRWDIDGLQSWGQFNLRLPKPGKPTIDWLSHYRLLQLAKIPRLSADAHRSLSSAKWLNHAKFQGSLAKGTLVYRGPIEAMPFQQHDAHLTAEFQVRRAGLHYDGDWPALSHLNSDIEVNNRQISAVFRHARIGHIAVQKITASIRDILHPDLLIDSTIKTTLAAVNDFLKASPMVLPYKKSWLNQRMSHRPLSLGLQFNIDFNHPVVTIKTDGNLGALGSSLDFKIRTPELNQQSILLNGTLNMVAIKQQLSLPMLEKTTGQLPFRTDIHIDRRVNDRWQIDVNSHHHVWLRLLAAVKDHHFKLRSGAAYIGEKASAVHPAVPGFVIYGQMPAFHWLQWKLAIAPFIHTEHGVLKMPEILGLPLRYIELYFDKFYAFHQTIDNLYLKLVPRLNDWMIDMKSGAVMGTFFLPKHSGVSWTGRLDYLYLPKNKNTKPHQPLSIDPRKIPPMDIKIQHLDYGQMNLGQVHLMTQPNLHGTTIKLFSITSPSFKLHLNGQWQQYVHQQTAISGWFYTKNLGAVLDASGVKKTLLQGEGLSHFQLNWLASPDQLEAAKLNGKIDFNFKQGRLLKTDEKATNGLSLGRIINAFSLQSLPKRLTFHFSDITAKGLEFKVLKGHFILKNGLFQTSDTFLDGPVARLNMKGLISFSKKHYDLHIKVLPYVTSSVPLIVGIIGGPVAGALTWLVNKLVAPEIGKAIGFDYDVKGDFDQPTLKLPLPKMTREQKAYD